MCGHFSSQIKKRVRSTHSISKLSRNVHNSLYSTYTIFKNCTKFCIFIVYNFSKNTHNFVCSIYMIFQKKYSQCCIFNIHNFSNNVHNSCKECSQQCKFNVHTFFQLCTFNVQIFHKCIIDSISIIFQINEHNYA